MADVFLSYARSERDRAEQIKVLLEKLGLSVFFDVEGLDGGDVFPDVLDHEVKTAGAVISLWSPHALSRPWIKIECRIAKDRGVLIPVSIAPINPLSDVPAAFYDVQHIDLVDFDGDPANPEWRKVVRSVARTLKRPELAQAAGISDLDAGKRTPPARKKQKGGSFVLAAAVAILVLAGAGAGLAVWRPWATAAGGTTGPGLPQSGSTTGAAIPGSPLTPAEAARLRSDLSTINFGDPALNGKETIERVLQRHPLGTLERAAAAGDPAAAVLMGIAHSLGQFVPADPVLAFGYFQTACNGGIVGGCTSLGFLYANGLGTGRDDAKAKALYETACEAGDQWGCFNLGALYAVARGVPLDGGKARELYTRACDGGVLQSCTQLGLLHVNAIGGPADFPAARALFERACNGGEFLGCANLGFMYASAMSVETDNVRAVELYRKSCDGGYIGGCSYLGYHLAMGLGVDKNLANGRSLLQRGCNARDTTACNLLASLPPE